jgi:hypothetical protein
MTSQPTFPSATRRVAVVLLGLVVLALHLALLRETRPGALPAASTKQVARPMQVRQVVVPQAPVVAAVESRPAPPPPPEPRPATGTDTPAPPAEAPPPPATDTLTVPVYATRLPPPATLHYLLRRGGSEGRAELVWQPDGNDYTLSLRARAGSTQPGWTSSGRLDSHGLAPERHAEWRQRRELRAANFRRDIGQISFSGPRHQHALLAGAQDRLSWMLQLAAIVAADPALEQPGASVQLFVAGARGDAGLWTFVVQGHDNVTLPDGSTADAVLLERLPAFPYDTHVRIWLDPARHHLPLRTRLAVSGVTGADSEYLLDDAAPP